jgi:hypothetical protein
MSKFKPQATFATEDSIRDYYNGMRKTRYIVNQYPTYTKLKRSMKAVLNASFDNNADIIRSRRGEWGEWFEHWTMVDGKPKIIKQGWM